MTELFTRAKEMLTEELNKPIPHRVILDGDLTTNDLAIYLAIQHGTNFDGTLSDLRSKRIENISGVLQPNQGKSIDVLEAKGYILRASSDNCYAYAIPEREYDEKFLVLPLSSMTKLRCDVKNYVSKLKCLVLANGNSTLPAYKSCKDCVSRYEYRQLKQIELAFESAIEMYESMHLRRSKSTYNSTVHNTAKNKQSLLESLKMDLELDALFAA
tara:strand:+ start:1780 stop:2421 length:642 start_codon:yes stop_codon:yes gene_type:complete